MRSKTFRTCVIGIFAATVVLVLAIWIRSIEDDTFVSECNRDSEDALVSEAEIRIGLFFADIATVPTPRFGTRAHKGDPYGDI